MNKITILMYALFLLLILGVVDAANIRGTVYSIDLDTVENAKVEINTVPKQVVIAKDSTYELFVPVGSYEIKAIYEQDGRIEADTTETIDIIEDGDYVIDLILFPRIDAGIGDEPDFDTTILEEKNPIWMIVGLLVILGVIGYLVFNKKSSKKVVNEKINDNELDNVVKVIKEYGGRTTQKDIRYKIPLSEAKISLMIADLESKGIVRKIKKGRGNIVILNKENEQNSDSGVKV